MHERRTAPVTRRERIEGGLWGLLVGDAVGVPYEFHDADALPPRDALDLVPPAGFRRAHPGVPPGTWSDDGAHALCLAESLLERDRLDPDDLMARLRRWHERGHLAVDGRVFDVGVQTARALAASATGTPALRCGPDGERDNGNGSLMRVLPLALWHRGSDGALVEDACTQSRVTHGHARSQVCCALYVLWARRTLDGAADPWSDAAATLEGLVDGDLRRELDDQFPPGDPAPGRGTGYVVDCLRSARHAVAAGSYADVVRAAIALGHDTDTTACVAGGLAGVRDGVDAIPVAWLEALRGRALAAPIVEALAARG